MYFPSASSSESTRCNFRSAQWAVAHCRYVEHRGKRTVENLREPFFRFSPRLFREIATPYDRPSVKFHVESSTLELPNRVTFLSIFYLAQLLKFLSIKEKSRRFLLARENNVAGIFVPEIYRFPSVYFDRGTHVGAKSRQQEWRSSWIDGRESSSFLEIRERAPRRHVLRSLGHAWIDCLILYGEQP